APAEGPGGADTSEGPAPDVRHLDLGPQHDAMARRPQLPAELEIFQLRPPEMPLIEPAGTLERFAAQRPARRPERRGFASVPLMEVVLGQIAVLRDEISPHGTRVIRAEDGVDVRLSRQHFVEAPPRA